jgi:hypothetical protein
MDTLLRTVADGPESGEAVTLGAGDDGTLRVG